MLENKIAHILISTFALIFDGRKSSSNHYSFVVASFTDDNFQGCSRRLLTIYRICDETDFSAANHCEFLTHLLRLCNMNWSNVLCFIGDNVSTSKALGQMSQVQFIGFASHSVNLAVRDILSVEEDIINKVNSIMGKLKG